MIRTFNIFRPNLSDYLQAIQMLVDRLNEDAAHKMSATDICKLAIERMFKDAFPGQEFPCQKKRKMYILLNT